MGDWLSIRSSIASIELILNHTERVAMANQSDIGASVEGNILTLSFSHLAIEKLLNLAQSGLGLSVKLCDAWSEASESVITGLTSRLDASLEPSVRKCQFSFCIEVSVPEAASETIHELVRPVIDFFAHEGVSVEGPNDVQPRSLVH